MANNDADDNKNNNNINNTIEKMFILIHFIFNSYSGYPNDRDKANNET